MVKTNFLTSSEQNINYEVMSGHLPNFTLQVWQKLEIRFTLLACEKLNLLACEKSNLTRRLYQICLLDGSYLSETYT